MTWPSCGGLIGVTQRDPIVRASQGWQAHAGIAWTTKRRNFRNPWVVGGILGCGTKGRKYWRCCDQRVYLRIADLLPQGLLFHKRQQPNKGAHAPTISQPMCAPNLMRASVVGFTWICTTTVYGQLLVRGMVVVGGKANLLEIITATHASRCFTGGLDGWKQQANQHTDDGDNN